MFVQQKEIIVKSKNKQLDERKDKLDVRKIYEK